jgi:hypothetical protein
VQFQNLLGVTVQRHTGLGQFDPLAGAFKKFGPVIFLQRLDILTDGWLGYIEDFGRPGKVFFSATITKINN